MTHDMSAYCGTKREETEISAYRYEPGIRDEGTKKRPEMLELCGLTDGMSVSPSLGSPSLKASPFVPFTLDIIVMIEFGVSGMSPKDL